MKNIANYNFLAHKCHKKQKTRKMFAKNSLWNRSMLTGQILLFFFSYTISCNLSISNERSRPKISIYLFIFRTEIARILLISVFVSLKSQTWLTGQTGCSLFQFQTRKLHKIKWIKWNGDNFSAVFMRKNSNQLWQVE